MIGERFSIHTAFKGLLILLISAVIVYPFIYMVAVSFSSSVYIMRNDVYLFPKGFTLSGYREVLRTPDIFTSYINTVLYVVAGTTLSLALTSAGAYALSKRALPFRKVFSSMVLICMFFSGGMIPTYLVVRSLGLVDTRFAMILPEAVSMWNLIIMVALFSGVPKEIEDAATIDGAGSFRTFWHIVLPLSKAALATVGLFYAVNIWNDFFNAMIYLNTPRLFPLTIILRNIIILGLLNQFTRWGDESTVMLDSLKYAILIVTILPIMCIYPFLQKYFVRGILVGSLKG
jgi:putative aldouronate transport system permease protein